MNNALQPKISGKTERLKWVGPNDSLYGDTGLIHYACIPPTATANTPAPLVIMLHGWAGNESSMWFFKQVVPSEVAMITPRALHSLDSNSFVWFTYQESRFSPNLKLLQTALEKLQQFIVNLARFYPVDPNRLVLVGFSQGAMMCNALAFCQPDTAIGVASLAGSIPPPFGGDIRPDLLTGLPVFIAHGVRDQVIPVDAARQTRQIFNQNGAAVTYNEYPSAHKMHLQAIKDLKQWLFRVFANTHKQSR